LTIFGTNIPDTAGHQMALFKVQLIMWGSLFWNTVYKCLCLYEWLWMLHSYQLHLYKHLVLVSLWTVGWLKDKSEVWLSS